MTEKDLSPMAERAYQLLTDEEKVVFLGEQKRLRNGLLRACISQVMARNQSHHVGKHAVLKSTQKK